MAADTKAPPSREAIRRAYIAICDRVLDAAKEINSSGRSAQAIDYSKAIGASTPKYKPDNAAMRTIEFCADVQKIINRVLTSREIEIVKANFEGRGTWVKGKFSDQDMEIKVVLGRAFKEHGIYPVVSYLTGIK